MEKGGRGGDEGGMMKCLFNRYQPLYPYYQIARAYSIPHALPDIEYILHLR